MGLFKIICWALIFLTRLRFPPGSSIATILKDPDLCRQKEFVFSLALFWCLIPSSWGDIIAFTSGTNTSRKLISQQLADVYT